MLTNARSIRNKMEDFKASVAIEDDLGIIAITETWLSTAQRDFIGEYHLPGYAMFHRDRVQRAGGRVLLYIGRHLSPVNVPIETEFEIVGAVLKGCARPQSTAPLISLWRVIWPYIENYRL